jgi:uncharacterized repeat protein (TIGR01451 family)
MKKILFLTAIFIVFAFKALAQGGLCEQATHILPDLLNTYPASVNTTSGQPGANYGCLSSQPNPAWFFLRIGTSGTIEIEMHSNPQLDIDFACWGPFSDPLSPCVAQLTAGSGLSSHAAPGPSTMYPSLNMVDCSYSTNWQEWCYLPNAFSGQYYLLMITNYSNQPTDITFSQTGGTGSLVYGTGIMGNIFFDANSNGIKDTNEIGLANQMVELLNANDNNLHVSSSQGKYFMPTDTGFNQIKCLPSQQFSFTTDSIRTVYVDTNTVVENIDFGLYSANPYIDVSVDLTSQMAVASQPCHMTLTYKNNGFFTTSGSINLTTDPLTTFQNSIPAQASQSGNTISWNYANLLAQETRQIQFNLMMPGVAYINDTLLFTTLIDPITGDIYPANNYDTLRERLRGSYDPNDKIVNKGIGPQGLTLLGEELEYTIRFQNTGNLYATTVRITDQIDTNMMKESFRFISSSHEVNIDFDEVNQLVFTFDSIMLTYSTDNWAESQGFVKFALSPKPTMPDSTVVLNMARIYFDSNPAILTNQTINTYVDKIHNPINIAENRLDADIRLYPNPAHDRLFIAGTDRIENITIYSVDGKELMNKQNSNGIINVTPLAQGLYFLRIETNKGSVLRKFIIE